MKPVKPTLIIELNVNCPECGEYVDLVADTNLNEEGWLFDQVVPDERWIDAHKDFECDVECPHCNAEFKVAGVEW